MPEGPVVLNNTPLVALWALGRALAMALLVGGHGMDERRLGAET